VAARRAEEAPGRPRPRPGPAATAPPPPPAAGPVNGYSRRPGRTLARPEPPAGQVVAAAGNAIVTAARVGRLLGRSGWRIAKQLPGVAVVEQQAHRLREVAGAELIRLLEVPQARFAGGSAEEQRVMTLLKDADSDPAPLRSAMSELLDRSSASTSGKSREYLFGTIVSQLVPDEARILAALAGGRSFPVVDVIAKQVGRSTSRTVLPHVSTVGDAAGVAVRDDTPTYLARLRGFGLVEFGPADDDLGAQYETLAGARAVLDAKADIERTKLGSARLARRTVRLSPLGREFWAACAPAPDNRTRRTS
jgi:Abortive infection alpha